MTAGDAAHPLLPALGQGACMAVEDGFELANGLGALLVRCQCIHLMGYASCLARPALACCPGGSL